MATTNLSAYDPANIPDAGKMRFGIVVSDWNSEITGKLLDGAVRTLKKHGALSKNIVIKHVPGTFELTLGGQFLAEYDDLDGVICLGCVIRGETPHFDYICQSVTHSITELNLHFDIPFIFGILTTLNIDQARERAGGNYGNKGIEAAITAIKMVALKRKFRD